MSDEIEWPREIWLAELDQHHNGTGMVVLSEFATVSRWEGDDERDCDFQRYVDADIHESAEKYHKAKVDELRAAAAAQVAAAYERAADLCVDQFQAHLDLVITGNPDNARNRESAANMAEKLSHEIRALATDTQTDALEQVRRDAERAGYERMRAKAEKLAEALRTIESHRRKCHEHDDDCGHFRRTFDAEDVRLMEWQARAALKEWYEGDPDEQAGYERGVMEALQAAMSDKAMRDAAFDAMWKVATETYSLEATNENGARYSITGDVVNALWYASMQSMIAPLDNPTPDPDEQTEAAQELAFRKAVSS